MNTELEPSATARIEPRPTPPPRPRVWPAVWLGTLLILVAGALLGLRSCLDTPARTVQATTRALADLASAFHRGTVVRSFFSYATDVTNYHYLQFATLKQTEVFRRKEQPLIGFGYIPLPAVEVEARAPVQYTYYLDLHDRWEFVLQDQWLYVFAPAIRFNQPSVDVSAMEIGVRHGYLNARMARAHLKQNITGLVLRRARENIPLVREQARKQVAEFIRTWLLRAFSDGASYKVKVFFPGERPDPPIESNTPRLHLNAP